MGIETAISVNDRHHYEGDLFASGDNSSTVTVIFGIIPRQVGVIVLTSRNGRGGEVAINHLENGDREWKRLDVDEQFQSTIFPSLFFVGNSE